MQNPRRRRRSPDLVKVFVAGHVSTYYLSYLHQTCMGDASRPTQRLESLGCCIWAMNFICWRRLRFLEQVRVFSAVAL